MPPRVKTGRLGGCPEKLSPSLFPRGSCSWKRAIQWNLSMNLPSGFDADCGWIRRAGCCAAWGRLLRGSKARGSRIADRAIQGGGSRDPGRRTPRSRAADPAIQGGGPRDPGRRTPRSRAADPAIQGDGATPRSRAADPGRGGQKPALRAALWGSWAESLGPAPHRALGWIPIAPLARCTMNHCAIALSCC